jgi:predicted transcriptional regulator
MIHFKASSASPAIILSVSANDAKKVTTGVLRKLIRKRYPKAVSLQWVYLWAIAPISAIVGRAPIVRLQEIAVAEALESHEQYGLSVQELREYCADYELLGVFILGPYEPAKTRLRLAELGEAGRFHPPQSFLYLSRQGQEHLCSKASFISKGGTNE